MGKCRQFSKENGVCNLISIHWKSLTIAHFVKKKKSNDKINKLTQNILKIIKYVLHIKHND